MSPLFYRDSRRFYKCPSCGLIFTNETAGNAASEKHYMSQWKSTDADFWKQQVDGLLSVIHKYKMPVGRLLDFGSGAGEITKEFQARGIEATPLDPMINGYLKDQNYPQKFEVVVGVEVIEHLPDMWDELKEIKRNLSADGIMLFTTILTDGFIDSANEREQFRGWWYKDDPTHVSFFSRKSVFRLAEHMGYTADIYGTQLFVLKRRYIGGYE
ncbi:MAG: class I SAM-dependent methyltransferase [Nitrospinota bacterium]